MMITMELPTQSADGKLVYEDGNGRTVTFQMDNIEGARSTISSTSSGSFTLWDDRSNQGAIDISVSTSVENETIVFKSIDFPSLTRFDERTYRDAIASTVAGSWENQGNLSVYQLGATTADSTFISGTSGATRLTFDDLINNGAISQALVNTGPDGRDGPTGSDGFSPTFNPSAPTSEITLLLANADSARDYSYADFEAETITLDIITNKTSDIDGDGILDHLDIDSDNDHISDLAESGADISALDANKNGFMDGAEFTDADSDGLEDTLGTGSVPVDTDGDGIVDIHDLDSDNDDIADVIEGQTTAEYVPFSSGDADSDGVVDVWDPMNGHGSDEGFAIPEDTDSDGAFDFQETDSDSDGMGDTFESRLTHSENGFLDSDSDGIDDDAAMTYGDAIASATTATNNSVVGTDQDFRNEDSDSDGIADSLESTLDVDSDGVYDYQDTDSDSDGFADSLETTNDSDSDGTYDFREVFVVTLMVLMTILILMMIMMVF